VFYYKKHVFFTFCLLCARFEAHWTICSKMPPLITNNLGDFSRKDLFEEALVRASSKSIRRNGRSPNFCRCRRVKRAKLPSIRRYCNCSVYKFNVF